MTQFGKITDVDGDVYLFNLNQLCYCTIERREHGLYNCTLQFCDNGYSFYCDEDSADRLIKYIGG